MVAPMSALAATPGNLSDEKFNFLWKVPPCHKIGLALILRSEA
jgi:hypothetical protein